MTITNIENKPHLEMKNLSAGYEYLNILETINISIYPSETIGLVGPNGSGKSTLFKAIMNLINVKSGDVIIDDVSLRGKRVSEIRNLGVAYLPQHNNVFGDLSVNENIRLLNVSYDEFKDIIPADGIRNIIKKILNNPEQLSKTLSGGEQRVLSVALGLFKRFSVLLADEPTLGLSDDLSRELIEFLCGLSKSYSKRSVMVVSHDNNSLEKYCDRVISIKAGSVSYI